MAKPQSIKSPAFQFYPKDYLADAKTRAMTYVERGMYWELVCHCWNEGRLPSDHAQLARILGLPLKEFDKHWRALEPCFRLVADEKMEHPRLEIERRKQSDRRSKMVEGGKRSAERRAQGASKVPAATLVQKSNSSSSSSTPVSTPNPLRGLSEFHVDEVVSRNAGLFLEQYATVYARARNGAFYRVKPARDHPYAMQLVTSWPDMKYLCDMLELFLRKTEWKPKNEPGSVGQFLHMAPNCDAELRRHGWQVPVASRA